MTATVKKFCRINGLDENAEDLVEKIYSALTGGNSDGIEDRPDNTGKEAQASVPHST